MRRFLRKLFHRRRMQLEMEAELAFHREMSSRHANPIPLGNTAVIAEHGYDIWRFTYFENLWRDLVYAARGLRRSPAIVLSALLSLGLGIGVNAAMFSLGMQFLLSRPSVRDPASWVAVRVGGSSHSAPPVLDFLASSRLFSAVAGENEEVTINYNEGTVTRPLFGAFVTRNYFTALGVPMLHGRGIAPDDSDRVAVLSYRMWQHEFAGDPTLVGRPLNLDGRLCTVIGILPEHHRSLIGFGYSPDVYLPQYLDSTILAIYARLKPGMSIGMARAGLLTVARRMDAEMPGAYKYAQGVRISPIAGFARLRSERDMEAVGAFFIALLAVTGLVLLIACVNVASLLLARASTRRREIAIRLAIGAGRGRLLQQLLAEGVLLSGLGAAAGLILAQAAAVSLARIPLPLPLPIHLEVQPDWRVGVYGAILAAFAALACGLLPAWQSVRESIAPDLRRESKLRLRRMLVGVQIAFSTIVLATGLLFVRNLLHSSAISPGFDVRHTIRANVNLPPTGYSDPQKKTEYIKRVLESLAAIPGIESVAAARILPFNGGTRFRSDIVFADNRQRTSAFFFWNAVTPQFFRTMGIPLMQGRGFAPADRGEHTVIVNPTFVSRYLGQRQPVGTVFLWGTDGTVPYLIVGVAQGTKTFTIGEEPQPQLYEPLAQIANDRQEMEFVLRSAIPPALQLDAVRRTLHRIEPMAGTHVETMYGSIGLAFLPSQAGAALMGSTGILGLLLATIGLYGVMAYSVARRTREIGVRMAIGANRGHVVQMVLRESAAITLAGTAAGLVIALFLVRPLAMFLVTGMKPADPLSFAGVAVLMLATGIAASWAPVRRALQVDPASTLRDE